MTASKSSRARNARAQVNSARNKNGGAANPGSARTGTAVKTPAPAKAVTGKASPVKANQAGSNGAARGTVVAARGGVVATSAGAAERSRRQSLRDGLTGAGAEQRPVAPFWLQLTTWLVAMAGLGVSIYLTIAHFTESTLAGCSETGLVNCTKVTTSPQSYVFGIPVAVLGLAFYLFAVAAMSPWAWRSRRREVHIVRLASTVVGIGFVLYLIYAELFIIGSICLYCTSVHVLTFVLFALTAFAAAAWGLDPAKNHS
jgi:uncharacterized membrane protein